MTRPTLFVLFAYVLASAASLHARTLRGAFLFTTGVLCLILIGLPFVRDLLDLRHGWVSALLSSLDPVSALDTFQPYPPPDRTWTRWSGPSWDGEPVLVCCAVYATAAAAIVVHTVRSFDRAAGRT